MTNRIGVVAAVLVVSALACTQESEPPPPASQAQRLDGCAHPICAVGESLAPACDPCAATVCAADPYCCSDNWDATCVGEVTSICGTSCTVVPGPDAGTGSCAHPVCAVGGPLSVDCSSCVTSLCAQDPYCCGVAWDATCVGEVTSICGQSCN